MRVPPPSGRETSVKESLPLFVASKQSLSGKKYMTTKKLQLTPIFVGLEALFCYFGFPLGFMWILAPESGCLFVNRDCKLFSKHFIPK